MSSFAYDFHYKPNGMLTNSKPAGLSLYGINGEDGELGTVGSTVYFIDKKTLTDADKETILQKIDNGQNINGSGMSSRSYTQGDLIICKYGNVDSYLVYRLVNVSSGSHKFGIQRYGMIVQPIPAHSIVDDVVNNAVIKLNLKYESSPAKIIVNRSFDSSTEIYYTNGDGTDKTINSPTGATDHINQSYSNSFKTLFGFGMQPSITFSDGSIPNAYDFYLRITIPITKGLIGTNGFCLQKFESDEYNPSNSGFRTEPMLNNRSVAQFEKIVEIPLNKYVGTSPVETPRMMTYFSDMTCDKLHPSQNNINVSFFDPKRSIGWESIVNQHAHPNMHNAYWFRITKSSSYQIDGRITDNPAFIVSAKQDFYDTRIEHPLMKGSYNNWHPLIQCSKRSKINSQYENSSAIPCIVNFRSGESAYFSGMVPNSFKNKCFSSSFISWAQHGTYIGSGPYHTYDAYVTMNRSLNVNNHDVDGTDAQHATHTNTRIQEIQGYVGEEIKKFILSSSNFYELVYVEKSTGLTKLKKLALSDLEQNIQS